MTQPAHSRIIVRFIATLVATVVAVLGIVASLDGLAVWGGRRSLEAAGPTSQITNPTTGSGSNSPMSLSDDGRVIELVSTGELAGEAGSSEECQLVGVAVTPRVHNHFVNGDHGSRFGDQEE